MLQIALALLTIGGLQEDLAALEKLRNCDSDSVVIEATRVSQKLSSLLELHVWQDRQGREFGATITDVDFAERNSVLTFKRDDGSSIKYKLSDLSTDLQSCFIDAYCDVYLFLRKANSQHSKNEGAIKTETSPLAKNDASNVKEQPDALIKNGEGKVRLVPGPLEQDLAALKKWASSDHVEISSRASHLYWQLKSLLEPDEWPGVPGDLGKTSLYGYSKDGPLHLKSLNGEILSIPLEHVSFDLRFSLHTSLKPIREFLDSVDSKYAEWQASEKEKLRQETERVKNVQAWNEFVKTEEYRRLKARSDFAGNQWKAYIDEAFLSATITQQLNSEIAVAATALALSIHPEILWKEGKLNARNHEFQDVLVKMAAVPESVILMYRWGSQYGDRMVEDTHRGRYILWRDLPRMFAAEMDKVTEEERSMAKKRRLMEAENQKAKEE